MSRGAQLPSAWYRVLILTVGTSGDIIFSLAVSGGTRRSTNHVNATSAV